jgi:hypothetical protein
VLLNIKNATDKNYTIAKGYNQPSEYHLKVKKLIKTTVATELIALSLLCCTKISKPTRV